MGDRHHVDNRCLVTKFNIAGSHDTAKGQHVQRDSLLFLVRSPKLYVPSRGREKVHGVFLLS